MQRFNLSQWSITHRPLVLFVIILLGAAGIYSYLNLGRAEDPSFTIKTMIVHVGWPGATATELAQVPHTETKLFLRSAAVPGGMRAHAAPSVPACDFSRPRGIETKAPLRRLCL
jgi:hypothetical protein